MFNIIVKSKSYWMLAINSQAITEWCNRANQSALISLGHYHISLGIPPEEILKYEDEDKKRITKGEYGILNSTEIEDKILKDLQSRKCVLRGNADRKSLAIKVDPYLVTEILCKIMPELTHLFQFTNAFKSIHLNGDIDLHISLANMTGNPRHSLKDPFKFKPRWIGVDLDGTLAMKGKYYTGNIGEVLPNMRERLLKHIESGIEVKIFTARVAQPCDKSGRNPEQIKTFIQDWLEANKMPRLDVTCIKSRECILFYDDKCVQCLPDKDTTLQEEFEWLGTVAFPNNSK